MTENVLLEIQKTFDFFKATAASDRIDRIVLSGGASRVDGFAAALAERFGAPVEPFDPFTPVAFEPQARRRRARRGCCRRRRSPWVSRSGRRATDDSHQPPRRRARAAKKKAAVSSAAQKLTVGCSADPDRRRWSSSAGGTGAAAASRPRVDAEIAAAQKETTRLHRSSQQVQQFEQRKAQLAAARHADRAAAQGADRPGPHARSDQPRAAADAVAHRDEADGNAERGRSSTARSHDADRAVGLRGQPRGVRLLQALGRHRQQHDRTDRAAAGRTRSSSSMQGAVPGTGAATRPPTPRTVQSARIGRLKPRWGGPDTR